MHYEMKASVLHFLFITTCVPSEVDCGRLEPGMSSSKSFLVFFMAHGEAGQRCTVQSIHPPPRRGD